MTPTGAHSAMQDTTEWEARSRRRASTRQRRCTRAQRQSPHQARAARLGPGGRPPGTAHPL